MDKLYRMSVLDRDGWEIWDCWFGVPEMYGEYAWRAPVALGHVQAYLDYAVEGPLTVKAVCGVCGATVMPEDVHDRAPIDETTWCGEHDGVVWTASVRDGPMRVGTHLHLDLERYECGEPVERRWIDVTPADWQAFVECILSLEEGEDPLRDGWEIGDGQTRVCWEAAQEVDG